MKTWEAVGLGLLVAMRSMTLPAVVSEYMTQHHVNRPDDPLYNLLSRPDVALLTKAMAFGEMVFDKTSLAVDRTNMVPLLGRMSVAGVLAAILSKRDERLPAALTAAAAAAVGTYAAYTIRMQAKEQLHIPDPILALTEDALVTSNAARWRDSFDWEAIQSRT
ncbi:MAG: hypothetical protein IT324_10470 [Anaerolineae bacterium]|nr:hypothetical protein [Anaerolineae bacterium]